MIIMKCPVCKIELNNNAKCDNCGFEDLRTDFLSQEDANDWLENVVIPYRATFETSNVLPELDWETIFKRDAHAKALFEVTIPVALKKQLSLNHLEPGNPELTYELVERQRQESIDAALGHIAIQTSDEIIKKNFVNAVVEATGQVGEIKTVELNSFLKPGDLAADLTNLHDYDLVIFEVTGKIKKEVLEILPKALSEYDLSVTIGKGPGSRFVQLPIPVFTAIFIVDSITDIPKDCSSSISSFIVPSFEKEELLEYQIREIATKYSITLSRSILDLLIKQMPAIGVKPTMKYISDYLFLHPERNGIIDTKQLGEILNQLK